jgi:hypothetical protein
MGRTRKLAGTVSAGGPLEDGLIAISDVTGLQAALDAKGSLVSGTPVTTSGASSYELSSIPATVKKIKLLLRSVSVSGASNGWFRLQLGTSGGYVTSGYSATVTAISSTAASSGFDNIGFMPAFGVADADLYSGVIELAEVSPNVWVMSGNLKSTTSRMCFSAGDVSLGAELTSVKLSIHSAGIFDGGTINVLYE